MQSLTPKLSTYLYVLVEMYKLVRLLKYQIDCCSVVANFEVSLYI